MTTKLNDSDMYLCRARVDTKDYYFIWRSNDDEDRVVTGNDGELVTFASEADARSHVWLSPKAPAYYDIETIEQWCRSDSDSVDCPTLLNLWNLVTDLPERGEVFSSADRQANLVYDKLFFGCNLPAMTSGEEYVPSWNAAEIAALKRLLLLGIMELKPLLSQSDYPAHRVLDQK